MSQVNKYADKAGYTADKNRKDTQSAVSYVEDDGVLLYDGVNTVIRKSAAGVGDLVVFDKTDSTLKFIKGDTLVTEKIPPQLIPAGVVYGGHGDKVRIVALENALYKGNGRARWAYEYEVKLSEFKLSTGGSFTLNINNTDYPFVYSAGATLESIAAQINANSTIKNTYGWTAKAADSLSAIVMSCDSWSGIDKYKKIEASGCTLTHRVVDVDYQTTSTGLLIPGLREYVRRKNGVDIDRSGCNYELFLEYYTANGSISTNVEPGSSDIICESVFTEADNPALVAAYPTYRDYLFGEHMMQYPSAYGAMLRCGKENTELIGRLSFIDIYAHEQARYPAAAAALDYGVTVEGTTTGLEAGAWWLPSVDEVYLLMRDRALTAADAEHDLVNRTLLRAGKMPFYASGFFPFTSCESTYSAAFAYGGTSGTVVSSPKYSPYHVRPVTEI
mgnify:CR=1 FL=1